MPGVCVQGNISFSFSDGLYYTCFCLVEPGVLSGPVDGKPAVAAARSHALPGALPGAQGYQLLPGTSVCLYVCLSVNRYMFLEARNWHTYYAQMVKMFYYGMQQSCFMSWFCLTFHISRTLWFNAETAVFLVAHEVWRHVSFFCFHLAM